MKSGRRDLEETVKCLLYCNVVVNIAVQDDFSNDTYAELKFGFLSTLGRQIKKIGDIFFYR